MWIIYIKLKYFWWEEKIFLVQGKREYKITGELFFLVYLGSHLYCMSCVWLATCQSEKNHIEIEVYLILVIFDFHELYLCKQRETFLWVFS